MSSKSGHVYERRLIAKYIAENGTDPVTGDKLDESDLIAVKASTYLFRVAQNAYRRVETLLCLCACVQVVWLKLTRLQHRTRLHRVRRALRRSRRCCIRFKTNGTRLCSRHLRSKSNTRPRARNSVKHFTNRTRPLAWSQDSRASVMLLGSQFIVTCYELFHVLTASQSLGRCSVDHGHRTCCRRCCSR